MSRASASPRTPTTARSLALGAAVALLAFLAYLPALSQGFVLGDDHNNLVFNNAWRGLTREHLAWMWTTFHLGHWQPLTWMTFGAEYGLWGMTPGEAYPSEGARYHILNLLAHATAAWLAFELFRRLLRRGLALAGGPGVLDLCAALGAALWAVHPLRVENVVWATERRDLLAAVFLLATLLAWLRWIAAGQGRFLVAALGFYVLSLCSKAWGMTLPAVLLVLDVSVLRRLQDGAGVRGLLRLVGEKLPFIALALPAAWLAARAQSSTLATVGLEEHGVLARLAQACFGLIFYLRKTLLPTDLSPHYLLENPLDPTRAVYLTSAVLAALASVAAWLLRRRLAAVFAAWFSYMALVSPVLGLLQSGLQKVADRYAYIALLTLCALAAAGLVSACARFPRARAGVLAATGLVLALAGVATWQQTRVWRDSVTLFERAVAVEPDNYIAQMNLATALREVGRSAEAFEHTELSIAAEPGARNAYARFHLGLLRMQAGDFEAALAAWHAALAVDPVHPVTLEVAANELASRGRASEALALFEAGMAARPEDPWVRERLALLYWRGGERARAETLWHAGLAQNERWAAGHEGLGRAALSDQQGAEAEQHLRRALQLEPARSESRLLLGRVLRSTGRVAEAEAQWREVLRREPGHPQAQQLLQQSRAAGAQGR